MLMMDKLHLQRAVSVFAVAQYEDTLLNHPVFSVPNSDCSGGFGGLSRRWGWRRRRWRGRAVSQEAAPPELIRLTPLCLVAMDGHSPSYPPSSGRLSGSRPACAICSSQGGDRKQSSTQLTLPLLIPALRFFHGWREMERFSFGHLFPQHLFLLSPLPSPGDSTLCCLPFEEEHLVPFVKSLLLSFDKTPPFSLLTSFWTTLSSSSTLLCTDQRICSEGGVQAVPRWFPSLSCCYSNGSKEAAVLQQPHRKPSHVLICTLHSHWTNELQGHRKPEQNQPAYVLFSRPVRLAGLAVIDIESLTGWR